jgi:hypothetical protein
MIEAVMFIREGMGVVATDRATTKNPREPKGDTAGRSEPTGQLAADVF